MSVAEHAAQRSTSAGQLRWMAVAASIATAMLAASGGCVVRSPGVAVEVRVGDLDLVVHDREGTPAAIDRLVLDGVTLSFVRCPGDERADVADRSWQLPSWRTLVGVPVARAHHLDGSVAIPTLDVLAREPRRVEVPIGRYCDVRIAAPTRIRVGLAASPRRLDPTVNGPFESNARIVAGGEPEVVELDATMRRAGVTLSWDPSSWFRDVSWDSFDDELDGPRVAARVMASLRAERFETTMTDGGT